MLPTIDIIMSWIAQEEIKYRSDATAAIIFGIRCRKTAYGMKSVMKSGGLDW